jgi:ADP-ribose pyrophosphatase YjhB (NUDIX family)
VEVVLQPVGEGLLVVRRGLEPGKGELSLPGGFIEKEEVGEPMNGDIAQETTVMVPRHTIGNLWLCVSFISP